MAIARLPHRTVELISVPLASTQTLQPATRGQAVDEMFGLRAVMAATGGTVSKSQSTKAKPGEEKVEASATNTKAGPEPKVVLICSGLILLSLPIITLATSMPKTLPTLGAGVSIFALLYIAAQGIERFLEPFSALIDTTSGKEVNRDEKTATFRNKQTDDAGKEAAKSQAELDQARANRTVGFWAASTILGMMASGLLHIYLLRIVGVTSAPEPIEILLTGLVIGGGSKPLHDLISSIEKSKNNASDPAETRAGGS
jgi:hypothetical protein